MLSRGDQGQTHTRQSTLYNRLGAARRRCRPHFGEKRRRFATVLCKRFIKNLHYFGLHVQVACTLCHVRGLPDDQRGGRCGHQLPRHAQHPPNHPPSPGRSITTRRYWRPWRPSWPRSARGSARLPNCPGARPTEAGSRPAVLRRRPPPPLWQRWRSFGRHTPVCRPPYQR